MATKTPPPPSGAAADASDPASGAGGEGRFGCAFSRRRNRYHHGDLAQALVTAVRTLVERAVDAKPPSAEREQLGGRYGGWYASLLTSRKLGDHARASGLLTPELQASYEAQPRSLPDHVEGLPPFTRPELKLTTRQTVCASLGRGVYELPQVLPRALCASVADEVKQRVKEGKWKSLFTKLPTRDVPVDDLTAREDMYRAIDASCHLVTLCTGQEVTYNRRQACVTVYDSVAEDTCCVCLETLKLDACLRPCQHMMCDTCARKVDKCPLCRKRVVKVDSAANFSGLPMHADGKPTSTSPTLLITLDGLGGWSYRNDQSGFQSYKLEPPVGGGMMVPGNIIHGDLEKCGTRLVLLALCRPIRESEKASLVEKQRVAALRVFGRLDPDLRLPQVGLGFAELRVENGGVHPGEGLPGIDEIALAYQNRLDPPRGLGGDIDLDGLHAAIGRGEPFRCAGRPQQRPDHDDCDDDDDEDRERANQPGQLLHAEGSPSSR